MSSIANPITGPTTPSTSSAAASSTDPLASESTFLTLLVSQLQNQDPLDPVDSNQFVSQLTEYSQLEQMIDIHSDTTTISNDLSGSTTSSTTGTPAAAAIASPSTPAVEPERLISPNTVVPNSLNTGAIN